ncbi:alkaline phosphatase family protein [Dyella silvatica]|uniref:alkaline phosphatase family protein n=1 Tax=Dyella silvatica TaxID=2992128 RepID=UPI0022543CBA|nr:alkaline phosphatase family protein [Dyella silvatica]
MRTLASMARCSFIPLLLVATGVAAQTRTTVVSRPDHVVVVMMENKDYADIVGNADPNTGAPFINALLPIAASFTDSHGVQHPSEPNYMELFSGGSQGITANETPAKLPLTVSNLGAQLQAAHYSFSQFAEGLPSDGFAGTAEAGYTSPYGTYYPSENVAIWWTSTASPQPLNTMLPSVMHTMQDFPTDFSTLPTVSFVHATEDDNMHNDGVNHGDNWLRLHMSSYAQWAMTHNSLLVLTWDESRSDAPDTNHIPTLFIGPMISPGNYSETINHYNVLRTLEDMYGLPYAGAAASANSISDVWNTAAPQPVVSLDSPGNLSSATTGAAITLNASVIANGHNITKVQFYNGSTLLGEATQAPYTFSWNHAAVGSDTLSVKALYDGGKVVSSAPVYVTLTGPLVPVDTTGLASYLSFDNTLYAQAGTHNASVLSGTARYVAGKFGAAASFRNNGSSGVPSDWVASLGNMESVYANDFTVSLWLRTASTTDAAIFGNKNWTSGSNTGWLVATTLSKSVNWNTVGGTRHDVGLTLADSQWHLIDITFSRTQNQVTTYLDGVAQNTSPLGTSGTASLNANFNTLIGGSGNGAYSGTADIDDLAIWSRVLSASEVSNIYQGGQAGEALLAIGQTGNALIAGFSFTVNGLAASFTDSSTDSGGSIGSHAWNFGDGASSTAANPNHTYAAAGSYNVTETVSDSASGKTNAKTIAVSVAASGNSVFSNNTPMSIGDNATMASSIAVSGRSGNASSALKVQVSIAHNWSGDLTITLIGPDGSQVVLQNPDYNDDGDINATYTVDASAIPANGSWQLQVSDDDGGVPGDSGTLNNWSLSF